MELTENRMREWILQRLVSIYLVRLAITSRYVMVKKRVSLSKFCASSRDCMRYLVIL